MNRSRLPLYFLSAAMLLSSCGTPQYATDGHAVASGAAWGGYLGSAIGGIIGESSDDCHGGYRGSAIGTLVGVVAGAAIGGLVDSNRKQNQQTIGAEPVTNEEANSGIGHLRISNIRFIDESRNQTLQSRENSKVIFDIINQSNQPVYNVVPQVSETTGNRKIQISPSVMIEQIEPNGGMKYTANVYADGKLREGSIVIRLSLTDAMGYEYDWQDFELPTER